MWHEKPIAALLGVIGLTTVWSGVARANGAFPDSLAILVPSDRPHEIVLATNFGLILSEDEGKTWRWTCEQTETADGYLYQLGPPPGNRIFAVSSAGVVTSGDGACTWTVAGGLLRGALALDVFPHPTDADRALAIAIPGSVGTREPYGVYESIDGGASFGALRFVAPADTALTSVEMARSDPGIIYVALYTTLGVHPRLMRTTDAGTTWETLDVEPMLGTGTFRIISVDPDNPAKLFLRFTQVDSESLAVSEDGGQTFGKPVTVAGLLTSFVRRANGTILVGGLLASGEGIAFRSTDGGATFHPWPTAVRIRALAERDGLLFAAGDNFKDGFALGVSQDEGTSWKPLLKYDQVVGIKPCAQSMCEYACDLQAGRERMLWSPEVCRADRPDALPTERPAPRSGGCGCSSAPGGAAGGLGGAAHWLMLLVAVALVGCGGRERPRYEADAAFTSDPPRPGPMAGHIVITNNGDDSLSVVDPDAATLRWKIPIGLIPVELEGPHHLAVDRRGEFVYVNLSQSVEGSGSGPHGFHGTGTVPGLVIKLRTKDGLLAGSTQVDRNPGDVIISGDGSTAYVTHYNLHDWTHVVPAEIRNTDAKLAVIDTATMTVRKKVPICPAAHGSQLSADGTTLFATCGPDEIAVVKVTDPTFPVERVLLPGLTEGIGCSFCPYAIGIAPDNTVWVSGLGSNNGSIGGGGVEIYDPALAPVPGFDQAKSMRVCGRALFAAFVPDATTPGSYQAYVPEQGSCGDWIRIYQSAAGSQGQPPAVVGQIALPRTACLNAHAIAISADRQRGYVICEGDHVNPGSLVILDLPGRAVLETLPVGVFPDGLVVVPKEAP